MNRLAIGIDLGGTQVRAALIDEAGNVQKRAALSTAADEGPSVVTEQLRQLAHSVSAGVSPDRLIGVGVSSPGPIDTVRGVALSIPTLAGFVDVPFRKMIEHSIGLPVWLENDGVAAALGEWRFGAGRTYDNLIYITVSTGIGGGVVSDGRLLHGRRGLAAHVGHMTIVRDGEICLCGNRGCWEAYASGTAFAQRARLRADGVPSALGNGGAPIDGRAVFAAASRGDELACALVAEEADLLGVGVANLLHLYSPDIVVIGGGMANGFDLLRPGMAARVASAAMPSFRDTKIVRAALGDNSGLIGAAALAFDAVRVEAAAPISISSQEAI
jgi:glucokinase